MGVCPLCGLHPHGLFAHPAALCLDGLEYIFSFFDAFEYGQTIAFNSRSQYGFTGIQHNAARAPVKQGNLNRKPGQRLRGSARQYVSNQIACGLQSTRQAQARVEVGHSNP